MIFGLNVQNSSAGNEFVKVPRLAFSRRSFIDICVPSVCLPVDCSGRHKNECSVVNESKSAGVRGYSIRPNLLHLHHVGRQLRMFGS